MRCSSGFPSIFSATVSSLLAAGVGVHFVEGTHGAMEVLWILVVVNWMHGSVPVS